MAIDFLCATCNGTLRVGDESAGRVIRCGACQTMLRVPGVALPPPPPPLAAVPVAPPRTKQNSPSTPDAEADIDVVLANEPLDAELLPLATEESPADQLPDTEATAAAALHAIADEPRAAEPTENAPPGDPTPTASPDAPRDAEPTTASGGRSWDPDWNNPYDRPRRDRDDDDRPRRRDRDDRPRRRPPPPPRGRGVLFWLLILGGVFVLLTVGCCGGLYLVIPGPKWQKHESARGGFKVDLPAAPRNDMDKIAGEKPDPNAPMEGTILFGRFEEYAIVYRDIPAHELRFTTDKHLLDEAVKGMKESGEVQSVLRQKDITVGGYPAREVEFSAKGGGWFASRIIIADSRVYVIIAGGRFAKPGNENARRFLDSFEITDPKLKAAGQTKADAEKAAAELARIQKEREEGERVEQAKRDVAARIVEAARRAEEERLAAIRRAEEERRRREAEVEAEKFRVARPGKAPPDPNDLPGLVLHLPFDKLADGRTPVLPTGTAITPDTPLSGPGVRGNALYLGAYPQGATVPIAALPPELVAGKSVTVAGWVKVRGATCDLISVPPATHDTRFPPTPVFTAGVTDDRARATDQFLPNVYSTYLPHDRRDTALSAPWTPDEKWHHVACVRRVVGGRSVAALYLDGAPVATFPFGDGVFRSNAGSTVTFGRAVPLKAFNGKPGPFNWPRGRDNGYDVPDQDLPVAAIDDVCAYGRALTDAEVRYLAGAGPKPGENAKPVRLVSEATIDANSGVAFDPERGTVWTTTAVGGYWLWGAPAKDGAKQSYLKAYSYPDFKPGASYLLPTSQNKPGIGGPPTLDAERNRLYLPLSFESRSWDSLQKHWSAKAFVYPFDLNNLPEVKGPIAPQLELGLARTPQIDELLDLIVSADGERVFYLDAGPLQASNYPDQGGKAVSGMGADLKGERQKVTVPRTHTWKGPLWVSADGKTLRTITSGRDKKTDAPLEAGVLEIDTTTWKTKVLPLTGVYWKGPQSAAWHPDGRLFVSDGTFGILEFDLAAGTRRVRPAPLPNTELPFHPTSFLRVSADGRYLIASETEQKAARFGAGADRTKNRVVILDAGRDPAQLGELAVIEETEDLRVGGPCSVSPDGRFVVFRSGVVLRIDDGRPALKPVPRLPVAPAPRPVE